MSVGLWAQEAIFTQLWVSRYETCRYFHGLTGSQRTPLVWSVTGAPTMPLLQYSKETVDIILDDEFVTSRDGGFRRFLVKWHNRLGYRMMIFDIWIIRC